MNRLNKYLPYYEKGSKVFQEITRVESEEFDKLYECIEDINKQIFLDTATWALAIYEKELGIPIEPNKTLEERRNIIKAKLKGCSKLDCYVIKSVVETFVNSKVEIKFDGEIKIVLLGDKLDIRNKDMYYYLEEVKPAHLGYKLEVENVKDIKININIHSNFSKFPLCNTVVAGEYYYIQNDGLIKKARSIIIQKQKYDDVYLNLCGITIVKRGKKL